MVIRPARYPQDLDALQRLFEECGMADGHAPIGEHKYLALAAGTSEDSSGLIFEDDGNLVGYVHLNPRRGGKGWVLETAIHPGHRHPGLIREVLQSAVDLCAGAGGGPIRAWVYHPAVAEMMQKIGFRRERNLLQMRRPLPPGRAAVVPTGLRLASFRIDLDIERWIEVNNRAFEGHPENGQWTPEVLAGRLRQPWFDSAGLLMAWQDDDLVGFCWTKIHPETLGEIYVIAIDPGYQRRSFGRWLTLEGLWDLHRRRGASTAMLYVDASNGPATGMYEDLGFELDHIDRSFVWEG
jgi:mycothiol synthase